MPRPTRIAVATPRTRWGRCGWRSRGTDALLGAALRLPNLHKILHVSSGLVYGSQPAEIPAISEKFVGGLDCAAPSQAYAEGKRAAEALCAAYRTQFRLPIVTVRPFAFLGPYQLLDRPWAANAFIGDALRGGPIRIQGDGQSVRSYMYPADMALWMLTILARGAAGTVYNLGSPQGITLMELAERIVALLPEPVKIVTRMLGLNAPRPTRLVPDISLARETLGLEIATDLDTAVRLALSRGTGQLQARKGESPSWPARRSVSSLPATTRKTTSANVTRRSGSCSATSCRNMITSTSSATTSRRTARRPSSGVGRGRSPREGDFQFPQLRRIAFAFQRHSQHLRRCHDVLPAGRPAGPAGDDSPHGRPLGERL